MSSNDLEMLIAAWLDGRLDAEGSQQLQQELRSSAAARLVFRKYAHLDAALHAAAGTSEMSGLVGLVSAGAEQHRGQKQDSSPAPSMYRSRMDRRRRNAPITLPRNKAGGNRPIALERIAAWCTAIAVGLLLTISLYRYFDTGERRVGPIAELESSAELDRFDIASSALRRQPPAPVATLSLAQQALWEGSQLELGQALVEGETISLQEGSARISVGFGAELVTKAPCSLTFISRNRVRLHEGQVAVDVAPWAKGFTVVTEDVDVVDLGTTFTVSASPGTKTEATVLKGVVRVHSSNTSSEQPRGLLVTEGQQISTDGRGVFGNVHQKNVKQLLRSLDFGVAKPYRPVVLNNTGIGLSVGDEDLHWRVIAGPKASFGGPQFAAVCGPERGYLPNDPKLSQWISISDWRVAAPNSVYTFQSEFDLEGFDLSTMQLFGRFLADNGVSAVRVNGRSVQVQSWVDNVKNQPFGYSQFRFVNTTDGLVQGRNVIEIDVRNGMQRMRIGKVVELSPIPNPMALRVEWYAFGRQQGLAQVGKDANRLRQVHEGDPSMLVLSSSSAP